MSDRECKHWIISWTQRRGCDNVPQVDRVRGNTVYEALEQFDMRQYCGAEVECVRLEVSRPCPAGERRHARRGDFFHGGVW